ncbi:N-acetylmuramate alpha-1-phosphate uridylyltransferase MurU [Zooshikella ganghwensis]|uniref:N-acetylmuramate alpha-1-phosphate uridylyltransferase MurU n=1 Tax=Zooshikella ganghwensis TaxID=202772 RepID=UPI0004126AF4|nr:nucleotidyltransferase family protein [Zooshikella ganghwensis]
MKVMLLAAGEGQRMRPLTLTTPKPMLPVNEQPLVVYSLQRLAQSGLTQVVMNTAYLAEKIEQALGNGQQFGVQIQYSRELQKLETGGGIFNALPLLGNEPFLVVNSDIWCDYPFAVLEKQQQRLQDDGKLAHLVLVPNSPHHPDGDFYLPGGRAITLSGCDEHRFTYSGISVLHPDLFEDCKPGVFSLAPLLRRAILQGKVTGELYHGEWMDIGTPDRLQQLSHHLQARESLGAK